MTFPGLPPIDRRPFIPDTVWLVRNRELVKVSRDKNPDEWERLVAADEALATHLKDDIWPTSSSSAPWLMAQMIGALQITSGTKVLEIGTGTGFNAACLAALGAEVISIEIDAVIAEQARENLNKASQDSVTVITGDGQRGSPENAPFDRVIATAAARTIPFPWVEQTKNGGLIVTPYTGQGHEGAMLVLTVSDGVARGGVEGEASFMPLRGHGLTPAERTEIDSCPDLHIEVTASGQRITTGQR